AMGSEILLHSNAFKLIPVIERRAVRWEQVKQRHHLKRRPISSVSLIQRANAAVAARKKFLPPHAHCVSARVLSCSQEILPVFACVFGFRPIAWQNDFLPVVEAGVVPGVQCGEISVTVAQKSLPLAHIYCWSKRRHKTKCLPGEVLPVGQLGGRCRRRQRKTGGRFQRNRASFQKLEITRFQIRATLSRLPASS